VIARQVIYAHNGFVKNNRQGSLFREQNNRADARSIFYEANIGGIFVINITVNSDYPDGEWSGFIWVSVTKNS